MDIVNSCLRWTTIDEGIRKLSKIGLVYTALPSLQSWDRVPGWGGVCGLVGGVGLDGVQSYICIEPNYC